MDKLILLASVDSNPEAGLIKSYLESNNINCFLFDSYSNQMFGSFIDMVGVQIQVSEDQYQEARELMKSGGFEKYLD